MDRKLKQSLKNAFTPPPPIKRNTFIRNLSYPKSNSLEFFLSQFGYIRKRFWCFSILLVIALTLFIQAYHTTFKTIGIVSAVLPFLVALGVTEISRSTSYNMAEVEMSCKYNLSKITLIRLSLIGSFYFIIILFLVIIFARYSDYSFLQFTLISMTPFLFCSYLSLFITNYFRMKDAAYVSAGVAGVTSVSVFLLVQQEQLLYTQRGVLVWGIAFMVTTILLVKEIMKLLKRTEELQWNSSLIV